MILVCGMEGKNALLTGNAQLHLCAVNDECVGIVRCAASVDDRNDHRFEISGYSKQSSAQWVSSILKNKTPASKAAANSTSTVAPNWKSPLGASVIKSAALWGWLLWVFGYSCADR